MKKSKKADLAVIGAGIMGLAISYIAARKGLKVVLFEKNSKALGASIRNFGLIWPIGQSPGVAYERALRSRKRWIKLAEKAGFWCQQNGSLHLAYEEDEMKVLEEFMESALENGYFTKLLTPAEILNKSQAVNPTGLKGGLWSSTELTLDPREAIRTIPDWLNANYNVKLRFSTQVNFIDMPKIETNQEIWKVQQVYVCSGDDFETLYPEVYASSGLQRVKLQMMRTIPQPTSWQLGPTLCSGLTLRHYDSFRKCKSLRKLKNRIEDQNPAYDRWGIHVMVSQNSKGELLIGDSHENGLVHEPFIKEEINDLILDYLEKFALIPDFKISHRWAGYYTKREGGKLFLHEPAKQVMIVNGLAGSGMTMSLSIAEDLLKGF